jgi:bifunctional non-homologous end joining protein LigD
MLSRNDRDVMATYPELGELAERLAGREVVPDGEIVALDPAGPPSFPSCSGACTWSRQRRA